MRTSLSMRAVSASAAVMLLLSLGPEVALAHAQASFRSPVMRPGIAYRHGQAPGWRNWGRQSWSWRRENGWNRWSRSSRWSRNGGWRNQDGSYGGLWNQGGLYGSGLWYSPDAYGSAGPGGDGGGGLIIVVGGPSASNFPAVASETADPSSEGGCVIHKLIYDGSGKYVGERQIPGC